MAQGFDLNALRNLSLRGNNLYYSQLASNSTCKFNDIVPKSVPHNDLQVFSPEPLKVSSQIPASLQKYSIENRQQNNIPNSINSTDFFVEQQQNPLSSNVNQSQNTKLFVGNVHSSATMSELLTVFSQFGRVNESDSVVKADKNFAFVHFYDPNDAARAIQELHEKYLFKDKKIRVGYAQSKNYSSTAFKQNGKKNYPTKYINKESKSTFRPITNKSFTQQQPILSHSIQSSKTQNDRTLHEKQMQIRCQIKDLETFLKCPANSKLFANYMAQQTFSSSSNQTVIQNLPLVNYSGNNVPTNMRPQ